MADRIAVTSLIRSMITVRKVAGKHGLRTTAFARFGLLDVRAQVEFLSVRRADIHPGEAGSGVPLASDDLICF
jgi:hypothetical protein